jgi:plastocyanin
MQLRSSLPRLGLLAALGVTGVGVAACGDDDKESSEASKPKTLAVSVDQAGKVTAPKTLEGGVVTLRFTNNAKKPYSLQMIRVSGNKTAADVLKVTNSEGAPIPVWLTDGGGIGTVQPGATGATTQELPAGRWFLVPGTEDEDTAKPQTPELEVTGGESGGALPKANATISAFEYGFNSSGLKAGNNTVEFANNGKQLHHVIALPMLPGKTLAQAKTFLTSENAKGQPPVDFENAPDTTVIDSGQKQVVTMNLKSGKYALVCFIQDRAGGPPHVNKGMITEATVS